MNDHDEARVEFGLDYETGEPRQREGGEPEDFAESADSTEALSEDRQRAVAALQLAMGYTREWAEREIARIDANPAAKAALAAWLDRYPGFDRIVEMVAAPSSVTDNERETWITYGAKGTAHRWDGQTEPSADSTHLVKVARCGFLLDYGFSTHQHVGRPSGFEVCPVCAANHRQGSRQEASDTLREAIQAELDAMFPDDESDVRAHIVRIEALLAATSGPTTGVDPEVLARAIEAVGMTDESDLSLADMTTRGYAKRLVTEYNRLIKDDVIAKDDGVQNESYVDLDDPLGNQGR